MGIYADYVVQYGGVNKAAVGIGLPKTTFRDRLKKEKNGDSSPAPKTKLNLTGIVEYTVEPSSDFTKIVYFTDAHNQPGLPLDRFEWLAGFVNDKKPDVLIDGGDFDDYGSLCTHEKNETYKGKLKNSLAIDLEYSAKARDLLKKKITHKCRQIVVLGNHEERIWRYEDANPEMYGIPSAIYLDILKSTGWEHYRFKDTVNVAGVDFTHVPFNKGKEFGGENAARASAKAAQRDIVFGHIHELQIFQDGKLNNNSVISLCGGCYMPDGYVASYAKRDRKEYFYGAWEFMIKDGRIKSFKAYHISELEATYGNKTKGT